MTILSDKNNTSLRKPSILFDKMVFKYILETQSKDIKFRTLLYNNLDAVLGYAKQSHNTYRTWFSAPDRIPEREQEFYNMLADALLATLLQQNQKINNTTTEIIEHHEKEMRNQ